MNQLIVNSILLPVRSSSQFLGGCIESLLWQSYSAWQLVAVLDRDTGINESLLINDIPNFQGINNVHYHYGLAISFDLLRFVLAQSLAPK